MVMNARGSNRSPRHLRRLFDRHVVIENELDHFALLARQTRDRAQQRGRALGVEQAMLRRFAAIRDVKRIAGDKPSLP